MSGQPGRFQVDLRCGLLRPQRVHSPPDRCRIALVGSTALLLGGDRVELDVQVGEGAWVELIEVAGTVAYDGRGRPASWRVRLAIAAGGRLGWRAEPFVVADGADVTRSLDVELAANASARWRETVVLGRSAETGGRLAARTRVTAAGRLVLAEDLRLLDPAERSLPGLLGRARVLDTVTEIGGWATTEDQPGGPGTTVMRLPFGAGTVRRWLGTDVASSPLDREGRR